MKRKGTGRWDAIAIAILFLIGLYVVFAPDAWGWRYLRERGIELRAMRVLVGFLYFFFAASALERHRMRTAQGELVDALQMLLYGKNYKGDREAVEILIRSLDSDDEDVRTKSWEHLKRLTGQNFALDSEVWKAWWKANEKKFAMRRKRPDTEE